MSGKWLIAVVVVALVLGGSATAALKITGKNVTDSSLTGKDVRDSSLTGDDIKDRSLSPRDFSESVRGPQGPQGEQGIQGPPGPTGLTVVQQYPTDVPVPAGHAVIATSLCGAPTEQAVSGGYLPTDARVYVVSSLAGSDPSLNRDGWSVLAANPDTVDHSMRVIAYCDPLPPGGSFATKSRSPSDLRGWQQLKTLAASEMLHLKEPHRP